MNRRQAINLLKGLQQSLDDYCEFNDEGKAAFRMAIEALELFGNAEQLPSAQPEIIRCNSCKHWTQSTGKMKGYGLGRCDFHDVDLVTCNGFCYWAERRTDG